MNNKKIYVLSSDRSGSTWFCQLIAGCYGYNLNPENYTQRGLISPLNRSKYKDRTLWDEPFHDEYLDQYIGQKQIWNGVMDTFRTCGGIVIKDHIEHREKFQYKSGLVHPLENDTLNDFLCIKMIRNNLWNKSLSELIASTTGIWGTNVADAENYRTYFGKLELNHTTFKHILVNETRKIHNLIVWKNDRFHHTLDFLHFKTDPYNILSNILHTSVERSHSNSVSMPKKEDYITNLNELRDVYLEHIDYWNNEKSHCRIEDNTVIPLNDNLYDLSKEYPYHI